jgi:Leucine-rich repeat (LRR) protein
MDFIDELPSLNDLDISDNQIEALELRKSHNKIRILNLSNNPLFDLAGIESIPNINKLIAEGIDITEPELIVLE